MSKEMRSRIIDSHIHLDLYQPLQQDLILADLHLENIAALISVSFHLKSCHENLRLSRMDGRIRPAFGYHPEQPLPSDGELQGILQFMQEHRETMVAVGEVGLPYYLRQEHPDLELGPYIELLKVFISQAKALEKPITLHAVYDDADIVVPMLEEASIHKAHFHWFKGSSKTLKKMKENGYYLSVTPDLLYEEEIAEIVDAYPLELMLVETDGPWEFEGPFKGQMTHPKMIHRTIEAIAKIKHERVEDVYSILLKNTKLLYSL
ncbi:TatD family deoxyribonuclease [Rossellomorea vietnamensis]|uniref:TatD family deoxyribonuclease n=3 Tax=Bacillaceae TaxID=186817 RepID=A0A5D4KDU7_9BACI|nr:TatD family deoxyribonuclease [Rossellomorea vietnamensis]TYS83217.1 TatD family deoxyribonuclease [Rossellomorea aquimaris]